MTTPALTQINLTELIACQHLASKLDLRDCSRRLHAFAGNMISHLRGRGIDFAETRCYQSGDDIRCMDWRVTARTGKPHVKLYQTERERPIVFASDLSQSLFFGTQVAFKSVIVAKITAILAWAAIQQGDRTGGVVFNNTIHHTIRPASRQGGILPLLNTLSQMTQHMPTSSHTNFDTALSQLLPITRPGSLVFIISDFITMTADTINYLRQLRAHSDVICLLVYDTLEATAPPANHYPIQQGQQHAWLNTRTTGAATQYTEYFNQRVNTLRQPCYRCAIPLLLCNTAEPLMTTLLQSFGQLTHSATKPIETIK